jgi:RND superfamily putative drug exporter
MPRLLYRLGTAAARRPWKVIAGWTVALLCAFGVVAVLGGQLSDDYSLPGTGSQRATDLLLARFPAMSGTDARVVATRRPDPSTVPRWARRQIGSRNCRG